MSPDGPPPPPPPPPPRNRGTGSTGSGSGGDQGGAGGGSGNPFSSGAGGSLGVTRILLYGLLAAGVVLAIALVAAGGDEGDELTYTEFLAKVEADDVAEVTYDSTNGKITGNYVPDEEAQADAEQAVDGEDAPVGARASRAAQRGDTPSAISRARIVSAR